ncbi:TetR/AcrR family transcriptional regulator [Streptomyces sp. HUAS TT20]|uniref:TetR/AcrR family transcriptional regulator n=1 Tax=Streptomyces sp. HUAS TT20 TaxID=3447509 RepID=UPI0021D96AEE|nr:TetR/AcrR family transcriptional regulator [Streptomyces sp. HUAS 15-9]UXY25357.1 TetR/AcrR family transcriptional regulator [Streptomyces sp. HUAS 15-9]
MTTARASAASDPVCGSEGGRSRGHGAGTKGVPRALREEQILGAALEEFGRHGHAAASMAEIARRVGVTKPMLYTYFGSKDGLYVACLDRIGPLLLEAMRKAVEASPPKDRLPVTVLTAVFKALEDRRHAWFVLYDRTLLHGSEPWRAARRHREVIDELAISGTAALLHDQGNVDPLDADALKHVWTGTVSALVGWWVSHPELSAQDMGARCERLLSAIRNRV